MVFDMGILSKITKSFVSTEDEKIIGKEFKQLLKMCGENSGRYTQDHLLLTVIEQNTNGYVTHKSSELISEVYDEFKRHKLI